MEPKWGAKNRMYYILTHDKLSFFRLLKFPPDLSYGPVMTVCCLAKWKLDFLSLLLVLSGSDQRFKRNGGKVFYRLIDGRLDMQKKKTLNGLTTPESMSMVYCSYTLQASCLGLGVGDRESLRVDSKRKLYLEIKVSLFCCGWESFGRVLFSFVTANLSSIFQNVSPSRAPIFLASITSKRLLRRLPRLFP